MAQNWVKIRALLPSDPKTLAITNWLSKYEPFRKWLGVTPESVQRNALVGVTLSGLIRVWAVGNSRGLFDEVDAVLLHCDFSTIDEIGQVPGLALAMESVHWLHHDEVNGVSAVRLPNFKEYNEIEEERDEKKKKASEANRIRQQRWRNNRNARNENVTADNACRAEQSRADENREAATATALCIDRGMQGGKVLPDPPDGFESTFGQILTDLGADDPDQFGFLARLAWADCSGFAWPDAADGAPRLLWDFVAPARKKRNPAVWLKAAIRSDLGPDRWGRFEAGYPSEAVCGALALRSSLAANGGGK